MAVRRFSDKEVAEAIERLGIEGAARELGMSMRWLYRRRRNIERFSGTPIVPPGVGSPQATPYFAQRQIEPHRQSLAVPNGIVAVGSDAHYWPGRIPFMHRAFCLMLNRFREKKTLRAVIANGDMLDFARLSRWPQINWEKQPDPYEEIEFSQTMMHEIEMAAGQVPKLWPGGNHDLRFNNWFAANAEKLKKIKGAHLKDHFSNWQSCWSVMINEGVGFKGATTVKHRIKGGKYAIANNVAATGTHIITAHLHASNVWAQTFYPGTLYGVDSGCIAEIGGPQFLYLEDNPVSWREGFVVLEYQDGVLMPPQLVNRHPDKSDCIVFQGETIQV